MMDESLPVNETEAQPASKRGGFGIGSLMLLAGVVVAAVSLARCRRRSPVTRNRCTTAIWTKRVRRWLSSSEPGLLSGSNQGRTRSFGILMAARPMWPCTRETSPLALSALCLSKPAFLKKRSGGFDLQQATP